jgi:hypothetical protein
VPEKFGMYYDGKIIKNELEKIMNPITYSSMCVNTQPEVFINREKLIKDLEAVIGISNRYELIKTINELFDKFEKDGVLPLPQ